MKRQELSELKRLKVGVDLDFILHFVILLIACVLPFVTSSKEGTRDLLRGTVLQYPYPKSLLELYFREKVFQIEPSDAIDVSKYSQPAMNHLNSSKMPSLNHTEMVISSLPVEHRSSAVPTRNIKVIGSLFPGSDKESIIKTEKNVDFPPDMSVKSVQKEGYLRSPNNFTEANLHPESSDAILTYQIPPGREETISEVKNESSEISYSSSFNVTTVPASHLNDYLNKGIMNSTENTSAAQDTSGGEDKLSSGVVAGIVIAVLMSVTLLSSTVIYLLYKKYNGKCTSVVESKFNTDNGGYLDDSLRSSIYLNNHIELPKESSEEMSSLDNDSFLNSLETMTIQNYWADNSKNTKV